MHAGIEVDSVDEVGTAKRIRRSALEEIHGVGTARRISDECGVQA